MFFTLCSAAVKAYRTMDPMELLVIRSLVQIIAMLIIALNNGDNLFGPKGHRWLLQLQGIVGGSTLALLFISFRRLPLGDATTIIFSSPVFVMIMSFIFLKEPCGFFRTFIVMLLIAGVILISKPPFILQFICPDNVEHHKHYDLVGYSCAVLATIFTAMNMVVMRKCKDAHFSVIVLQLSLWSMIVALTLMFLIEHGRLIIPRGLHEWGLLTAVSVFGLSGQILVARALGMEGAGKVAVTRSLDIVLAFILQVFAFGEVPDWFSVLGAILVLVCVIGMGLESQILHLFSLIP